MGRSLNAAWVAWDAWWATRGGAAAIIQRQRRRLAELVAYARAQSPLYAERYRGLAEPVTELTRLPIMTKAELMADFDRWVTDRAVTRADVAAFVADPTLLGADFLGRYVIVTTSGSTGEPALLVHDARVQAVTYGLALVRNAGAFAPATLWRIVRGRARQAAIFATGGHYLGATMFARRARQLPLRRHYARLLAAGTPLPALVTELNAFQPSLLGGYPSALHLLADEQAAGRLHLRPALISVAGETLTAEVRAEIEAAFGCRLLESYSASEAPVLTLPCRYDRLHVNADWFLLEAIDAAGRPVPPGELSHSALVTNLANYVQPVIRYALGDRIMFAPQPCPCGSPLPVVQVEGRTDDILKLTTPDGRPISILPLAILSVAEAVPGVARVQLIQSGPRQLTVRLAVEPGADGPVVWSALAD